ncbi:MAG TPA: SDR family oxidoreductase [Acidimicrobiia bacterium]|nr:SDR family oxidoreductase [Acidimicrobiia bacterium]
MRLQDRVAIVTGAGQGIGKEYARRLLSEGAKVAVAELSEARGAAGLRDLEEHGDVILVRTDVADEASTLHCAQAVLDAFGRIDILVNNAALFQDFDKSDHSYDYLQLAFRVNLHGAWLMARAVAPAMVERHWGRIVNISSAGAYMHPTFEATFEGVHSWSYNQTKWGILGLTKYLAGQLGQYNITVNCIAPGVTMSDGALKTLTPERIEELRMMSAMRRVVEPSDLAGVVAFFASDDAALVTGQVLCVDGGNLMPA